MTGAMVVVPVWLVLRLLELQQAIGGKGRRAVDRRAHLSG